MCSSRVRLSPEILRPGGQLVWPGKINVDRDAAFRWGALMGEKRIVCSSYGGGRPRRDFPGWQAFISPASSGSTS